MTAKKPKPPSVREALAAKKVRTTHYDIPMVDSATIEALTHDLDLARQRAFLARDEDGLKAARVEVTEAEAALDGCFRRLEFRGLPGDDDLDALFNAHPATEEQKAKNPDADLDLPAFQVAYMLACVTEDTGMDADEWHDELWSDRWTPADRAALFAAVHRANDPSPSAAPKG